MVPLVWTAGTRLQKFEIEASATGKQVGAITRSQERNEDRTRRPGDRYEAGDFDKEEWQKRRAPMLDRRRELEAQAAAIDPDEKEKLEKALEMAKNIQPLRDRADNYRYSGSGWYSSGIFYSDQRGRTTYPGTSLPSPSFQSSARPVGA